MFKHVLKNKNDFVDYMLKRRSIIKKCICFTSIRSYITEVPIGSNCKDLLGLVGWSIDSPFHARIVSL